MAKSRPLVGSVSGKLGDTVHYGSGRVRSQGIYPECSTPAYRSAIAYLVRNYAASNPAYKQLCAVREHAGKATSGLMRCANIVVRMAQAGGYYLSDHDIDLRPQARYLSTVNRPTATDRHNLALSSRWFGAGYQLVWRMTDSLSEYYTPIMYYLLLPAGRAIQGLGESGMFMPWLGVRAAVWPTPSGTGVRSIIDSRCTAYSWGGTRPACVHASFAVRKRDSVLTFVAAGFASSPG